MNLIFGKYADEVLLGEVLAPHTHYKIGGPAEYYFVAKNADDLAGVIRMARKANIPVTVIGGGCNILVATQGVRGLVVQTKGGRIFQKDQNLLEVCSGVAMSDVVEYATQHDLEGIEFGVGVFGSIGGAVYTNASSWDTQMASIIENVTILDENSNEIILTKQECDFGYQDSVFKKRNLIILKVTIRLIPGIHEKIIQRVKEYKGRKLAIQPVHEASCGSIFKNIPFIELENAMNGDTLAHMIEKEVPIDDFRARGYMPAGLMIEYAGFKGKKIGGIRVSEVHGNFLINDGRGTSDDVVMLISFLKQQIRDKYGIQLQEEVVYIGF